MAGNVFAMVFPGPYDTVIVIQYQHGEPKNVYTESTHANVWLATTSRGVEVTLARGRGARSVRTFAIDDDQLTGPAASGAR